jgi:hypothetical protein
VETFRDQILTPIRQRIRQDSGADELIAGYRCAASGDLIRLPVGAMSCLAALILLAEPEA